VLLTTPRMHEEGSLPSVPKNVVGEGNLIIGWWIEGCKRRIWSRPWNDSPACQCWGNEDIVVEAHATDEDEEPDDLEIVELLPLHGQTHYPNHQSSHRVQDHPCSRTQLLCYGDPSKVEKGNGNYGTWN